MDISDLVGAVQADKVRITDHAYEEANADKLTFDEIYFSALHGEIIEDYPDDTPYPSCLVSGQTFGEDPVHSVWAYNDDSGWAVLITVYRPDPKRWINCKIRRLDEAF
jgi:hypothetical protein